MQQCVILTNSKTAVQVPVEKTKRGGRETETQVDRGRTTGRGIYEKKRASENQAREIKVGYTTCICSEVGMSRLALDLGGETDPGRWCDEMN
jgi:hypothetical protein